MATPTPAPAPTPLFEIPTVVATQLVPSARIPLASGTLALSLPPTTSETTKLLLTIGTLTIPFSSASIAVCTRDKLTYLLATPLSRTDTAFVELALPSIAAAETAIFERILESHEFLKNALVDNADGLVGALEQAIGEAAGEAVGAGGGGEVRFTDTTHKIASSAVEGSAKIAEFSGMVAGVVSSAAFGAGRWVGEKLGVGTVVGRGGGRGGDGDSKGESEESLPRGIIDQTIATMSAAAPSLGQSTTNISATIGEGASSTAEENYRQEARGLVDSARETTRNVGKVEVDEVLGTSVIWHAGEAAVGVVKAERGEKVEKMEDAGI